jgi:thiopeptide-type bacteriocin biosynthesis protein
MQELQKALAKYIEEDLLWKIQIDTYQRELKRYGFENILYAESLFSIESNMVVDVLPHMQVDDQLRWRMTVLMIDELLNCFVFTVEGKNKLLLELKEGYSVEFGMNKGLKIHLDAKFRKERKDLAALLEQNEMENEQLLMCKERIALAVEELIPIAQLLILKNEQKQLQVDFQSLIKSFIHMLCNRCFLSKPREQEFVVYYLMSKYYQSKLAREKSKSKVVVVE